MLTYDWTKNRGQVTTPQFYLAPTKAPKYFEPDRGSYGLHIADLESRPAITKTVKVKEGRLYEPCVAIDFGTSTTCVCAIDFALARSRLRLEEPLIPTSTQVDYLGPRTQVIDLAIQTEPVAVFRSIRLHARIAQASERLFLGGHYSQAVFETMKATESFVKERAGNPKDRQGKDLYGRPLMGKTFDSDNPLILLSDDCGVQDAYRDLLSGLMGLVRNRFAHEDGEMEAWEAITWISLADLLLKTIDAETQHSDVTGAGGPPFLPRPS